MLDVQSHDMEAGAFEPPPVLLRLMQGGAHHILKRWTTLTKLKPDRSLQKRWFQCLCIGYVLQGSCVPILFAPDCGWICGSPRTEPVRFGGFGPQALQQRCAELEALVTELKRSKRRRSETRVRGTRGGIQDPGFVYKVPQGSTRFQEF